MKNKNKISFLFFGLCVLAWLFILPDFSQGEEKILKITEVQYEKPKESKNEFIKIKNITKNIIDLEKLPLKLHIVNSTKTQDACKNIVFNERNNFLASEEELIFSSNERGCSDSDGKCTTYSTSTTSLVENGTVYISKSCDDNVAVLDVYEIIKVIPPEPPKEDPTCQNWQKEDVIISEFLPAPNSKDSDNPIEFIELYNQGSSDKNISGWKIKDEATDIKNAFVFSGTIKKSDYLVIKKEDSGFSFALNNSGEEIISLYDNKDNEVSQICYSGSTTGKSYVYDGNYWKKSLFPTPNSKNNFNSPPSGKSKKDKNFYVGMYADFEAKGSDADNDKLKYTWDFGDGHKSYLAKTRHKFEKKGRYLVTLKISDGTTDTITTTEIEVENYPEKKVGIVEISPNPKGKDTEGEYVLLQSKEKKDFNLNGWSIATGKNSKKMINHPITEDLIISKKGTLRVTREFSKFSLNNTKGKVELRYPNGEVASKVKYNKEKTSVAEDEVFSKIDKKWAWQKPNNFSNDERIIANTNEQSPIDTDLQIESSLKNDIILEEGIVLSAETEKNINNKFINYASKINPSEKFTDFENYPLLELENKYFFLSPLPEKKHYLFSFWENLQLEIKSFIFFH